MELLTCAGAKSKEMKGAAEIDDGICYDKRKNYHPHPQQLQQLNQAGGVGVETAAGNSGVGLVMDLPEVNGDLLGMPPFMLIIQRGPTGFGFTVFGSSPVQVGRVETGSPASEAGLMTDDYISRINGVNVSRSTAESVAKIVKESERQIALQIHRSSTQSSTPSLSPPMPSLNADHCPSCPPSWAVESQSDLPCPAIHTSTPPMPHGRQPFASIGNLHQRNRGPRAAAIAASESGVINSAAGRADRQRRLDSDGRRAASDIMMMIPSSARPTQTNGRSSPTLSMTSHCESFTKNDADSQRSKNVIEDCSTRQLAIHKLSACETDFNALMRRGVSCYLLSLEQRPDILSSSDHAALFLNLETIYRLSEERQLHWEEYDETSSTDSLSAIYQPQIDAFYQTYEAYCGGIRNSIRLLVELKKSSDFAAFVRSADCNGQLTMSSFLKKPIEHIKDLVIGLQKVFTSTPTQHPDYDNIRHVVHVVRSCCNRINENNNYASSLSLTSSSRDTVIPTPSGWSSTSRSTASTSSSSSSSRPSSVVAPSAVGVSASIVSGTSSSSVISSIDSELLEIQSRLVFPKHIPVFHLATALHHLIYSGELQFIDYNNTRTALYVVLMSDLLLLTRPDPDTGNLEVFEQPIGLQDIVGSNFMCSHPCEFVLSVETRVTSLQDTWKPHPLAFRAPSVELKCTWKNILEQRILTCKAQRQQIVSSRSVDNIV